MRVDTGVEQGDEITPHYDPMIAKLIVWGADRRQALARMRQALAQYRVVGVSNNVDFLARLVAVPSFANAELDTGLIEREQALLFPPAGGGARRRVAARGAGRTAAREAPGREEGRAVAADPHSPWRALDGWRLNGRAERKLALRLGERCRRWSSKSSAGRLPADARRAAVFAPRHARRSDSELHAQLGERRVRAAVVATGERRHVFFEGRSWPLVAGGHAARRRRGRGGRRRPARADAGQGDRTGVEPGATVEKGAPLLVLEAMKMEHTISAPRKGVVKAFRCARRPGTDGAELVDFEGAE